MNEDQPQVNAPQQPNTSQQVNPQQTNPQADVQPPAGQGTDGGNTQQVDQTQDQTVQPQQPIDYERAYKNLEPAYTKSTQELSKLKAWEDFEKRTGINAEAALQQLDMMDGGQPATYQQPYQQSQAAPSYQQGQPQQGFVPNQPTYDPRVSQLEQELSQIKQEKEVAELRAKFPQFDEFYPQALEAATNFNLDLKTAFGKVMVDQWGTVAGKIQQQAATTMQQRGNKQLEQTHNGGGVPEDAAANLTNDELEAAQALGIDPKDYAAAKGNTSVVD